MWLDQNQACCQYILKMNPEEEKFTHKKDENYEGPRFWTVQKQVQSSVPVSPNATISTSRQLRKKCIRHVTLKSLKEQLKNQDQSPPFPEDFLYIYQVLGRISGVTSNATCYLIDFQDDTERNTPYPIIFIKQSQTTLWGSSEAAKSFSSIQFQKNEQQGHPYFRLWLRVGKGECVVQRIQKVKDFGVVAYHRVKCMMDAMMTNKKKVE